MSHSRASQISNWRAKPRNPEMDPRAVLLIGRRRRQMLIHCYLYYQLDTQLVSDAQWSQWAQQLARVQDKFGKHIGFYDKAFADWDGSSGFHLSRSDPDVRRVAHRLLDSHNAGHDLLVTRKMLNARP